MRVTVDRKSILAACQTAGMAAAGRDIKPILKNLHFAAYGESATLAATDLEVGLRIDVASVKSDGPGDLLLPPKAIPIFREMPDTEVVIESDSAGGLRIFGAASQFEMASEDVQHFPKVPEFDGDDYFEVQAGPFRQLIERTIYATADCEHNRFGATTGVMFEFAESVMNLVATDGRRLAVANVPASVFGAAATNKQTIVPAKAMAMLLRILANEADGTVRLKFTAAEFLAKTATTTVYSRLVEGRFPAYRSVIPSAFKTKLNLAAGPLLGAVRQAAIMTDTESRRVTWNVGKGKLVLQANGMDVGRSKIEHAIDYDGKKDLISFDPAFVSDFLKTLPADSSVEFAFDGPDKPALFTAGADYRYVVVPLVSAKAEVAA